MTKVSCDRCQRPLPNQDEAYRVGGWRGPQTLITGVMEWLAVEVCVDCYQALRERLAAFMAERPDAVP